MATTQELLDATRAMILKVTTSGQRFKEGDIEHELPSLAELRAQEAEYVQQLAAAGGGTAGVYTPFCGG